MDSIIFAPFTNIKKLEFCMHGLLLVSDYLSAVERLFWQLGCALVAVV